MAGVVSRRTFLQLVAAGGAAAVFSAPGRAGAAAPCRIASALPLPSPHAYFPDAEAILTTSFADYDLVLVPAYLTTALLQRNRLGALPPEAPRGLGRPHDPEAAFTVPYAFGRSVWLGGAAPLEAATVYLPPSPRLALSAVLQVQGHSPNSRHAGHWAQAAALLQDARFQWKMPRKITGREVAALGWQWAAASGEWPAMPATPSLWLEYDWVLPRAVSPAALAFLAAWPAPAIPPFAGATPLQTLAPGVRAQLEQSLV